MPAGPAQFVGGLVGDNLRLTLLPCGTEIEIDPKDCGPVAQHGAGPHIKRMRMMTVAYVAEQWGQLIVQGVIRSSRPGGARTVVAANRCSLLDVPQECFNLLATLFLNFTDLWMLSMTCRHLRAAVARLPGVRTFNFGREVKALKQLSAVPGVPGGNMDYSNYKIGTEGLIRAEGGVVFCTVSAGGLHGSGMRVTVPSLGGVEFKLESTGHFTSLFVDGAVQRLIRAIPRRVPAVMLGAWSDPTRRGFRWRAGLSDSGARRTLSFAAASSAELLDTLNPGKLRTFTLGAASSARRSTGTRRPRARVYVYDESRDVTMRARSRVTLRTTRRSGPPSPRAHATLTWCYPLLRTCTSSGATHARVKWSKHRSPTACIRPAGHARRRVPRDRRNARRRTALRPTADRV